MTRTLTFFLLAALAASCSQGPKTGATITGKAENLTDSMFILGGPAGGRDTIRLDEKGAFTITLADLSEPANYYILSGSDYISFLAAPGMKVDLSFDQTDFLNSVRFTGKGSDICNYMAAKARASVKDDFEWFKLEAADFRAKQDSMLTVSQKLFKDTKKRDPADPFWAKEEGEILYGWAGNLDMFEAYHQYVTEKPDYKVPEGFDSYKKDLEINNPRFIKSNSYFAYVSSVVRAEAEKRIDAGMKADSTATIDKYKVNGEVAVELLTEPAVLNRYLFNTADEGMQWKDIAEVQSVIDLFREKCKDPEMIKKFDETYNAWKLLEKGQPAIDFSGKDMQGNTVKLSDFKGKYVYVDVWATWCGPCIGEIPYLDSLETDYEGKNIVFISYSIDDNHAAWMKFVPEKQLKGVQIIGEKAWQSQLCKDYKIKGVPTFMFFDPEGRIISVKMTRPSDEETRKMFTEMGI